MESSIDLSRGDDAYERILKLIVLGKYEEGLLEERMVDDAWLLILSIGLKREQRGEKEQGEQFKRSVKTLAASHKEKHLQGQEGL